MYPTIHLTKGLEIPSFFLVISLVISFGLYWGTRRAKIYKVPPKAVLDLGLVLMISSLVGARLFHVFYENLDYYLHDPKKIFFLWEGGFVFFGGAFLGSFAALIFFKLKHIHQPGPYFDLFAPILALTYGLGRIGCFLAGCCYGTFCEAPWAIAGRHPTQLYATFWELGALAILLGLEKKHLFKSEGSLFVFWISLHSAGRILMESFRADFRGSTFLSISISSFISWILLILSLTWLAVRMLRSKKGRL